MIPTSIFTFDDGYYGELVRGQAYLTTKGLSSTLYYAHSFGQTEADLLSAWTNGMEIANHTYTHYYDLTKSVGRALL